MRIYEKKKLSERKDSTNRVQNKRNHKSGALFLNKINPATILDTYNMLYLKHFKRG